MRLDPNPLFRKIIAPWYDSTATCLILITVLLALAVFSIIGWVTARANIIYHAYTWIPVTLLTLCLFALFSLTRRLIHRHYDRYPAEKRP